MTEPDPHGPLIPLSENLYVVEGEWGPLRRRMTLVRLESGELVVHSPMRLREKEMEELEGLGPVRAVIMPNLGHGSDLAWYSERYPGAGVYAPAEALPKVSKKIPAARALPADWPGALGKELPGLPVEGMRWGETAFFHPVSRTLIVTDLVFNFRSTDFRGLTRLMMKWNRGVDRFGPTRSFYLFFCRDRAALRKSIGRLLDWDFDRVIMSHGHVLESGGKSSLAEAFAGL